MAEKIPDILIDEILASAKQYESGGRVDIEYSADKIDRLLADIAGDKAALPKRPAAVEKTAGRTPKAVKNRQPEPVTEQKAAPTDTSVHTESISAPQPDSPVAESEQNTSEETAKPAAPLKKNRERLKGSLNLRAIKNRDAGIPVFGTDAEPENSPEDVSVHIEENGQLGLTADGVEIGSEEPAVPAEEAAPEQPSEREPKSVSGQISIEKTRMFNEVKIRGEYNPNISHNLGNKVARTTTGEAQPLSSPVMGEEKYRQHFMNKPSQKLVKTQEHRDLVSSLPQKTLETPGVIIRKSSSASQNTDGIQPIPTLIPVEYELEQEKTRLDIPRVGNEAVSENQIVLDGFGEIDEAVHQTEEQAEAELRRARRAAVNDFVSNNLIFKQEVDESAPKSLYERRSVQVAREYFGPKDKSAVEKEFFSEKKRLVAKLTALSLLCAVISVLAAAAGAENGSFELYGNNEVVYSAVQLGLLFIACCISASSFTGFFRSIRERRLDMCTPVVLSALAAAVQCTAAFFFPDNVESVARLLTGAALIPMILKTAGELVRCKNDLENFWFISENDSDLYTVENIGDEDTATEIARGLMLGAPEIKYSRLTDFPARFVELSRSADVTGMMLKFTVPVVLLAAVAAGAAYGVLENSIFGGISAFTAAVLMGIPVAAGLASAVNLSSANSRLREDGAVINGYAAVEDAVNSNGVIIDACDAFLSGGCNIEGIKLYHKMRIDEALLYTASVVIASGGVLSDIFDGVIIGKRELLLPVESLAYEERLGCSCWIHNHRVLVGNRELLLHHNVEVPDRELEDKYKSGERNVIYLAVEGKIAAMFVVVYKADGQTGKYLRQLERDGMTIFFRTSDANINEAFIEDEFDLPQNVVKIINPVAGEMFLRVKNDISERSDAKIVHDGRTGSMLRAIHGAHIINSLVNAARAVQLVASLLGVAVVVLLTFMSGLTQVGVWQIIIYQAVWTLVLSLMPRFRKI